MKALVYKGPHTIELDDVADASTLAPSDVIVRVAACGICGSDMHAYHGADERRPPPLILGHEASGTIAAGPAAGRRVTINPLISCGRCNDCYTGRANICAQRSILSLMPRPGALAEFVAVPIENTVEIRDETAWQTAALAEPFAVSYHAVNLGQRALHRPLAAASVGVIGGGAIGLAAAQILRSRGARSVLLSEPSAPRRAMVARLDAVTPYDPSNDAERPGAASLDLVIDAYGGAGSRAEASRLVRPGGAIIHIGLASGEGGLDIRKLTLQEVTFIGTYTYTMAEFRETVAGLETGQFGAIPWTECRPLAEGKSAFADLDSGTLEPAKIILTP